MTALSRKKASRLTGLLPGVALLLVLLASGCSESPLALIVDTDISSDVDDVAALAVAHHLAKEEELPILAVQVSSGDPWAAACVKALNAYLGQADIPVGQVQGRSVKDQSRYTETIAGEFGQTGAASTAAVDALGLYRQQLAASPDASVVIISLGYLTNLANLLASPGDAFSPLPGRELVAQKVKRLVCMGGEYPKGREWNFYQDTQASATVLQQWPTEIIFCGFESGKDILTGQIYGTSPANNPLRRSYELYNNLTDRPSWDQLTVLYAIKGARKKPDGLSALFTVVRGKNVLGPDGANNWLYDQAGRHYYVRNSQTVSQLQTMIADAMLAPTQKGAE